MRVRPNHRRAGLLLIVAVASILAVWPPGQQARAADASSLPAYQEPYRPQFHYTPRQNWMNDPNGLVFHDGEYHLFYQHNPNAPVWGDMSWGHAVSTDLVHWRELPVAIPADEANYVFSGSIVVDRDNTSGLGTRESPPMVAIYTQATRACCSQTQALAYSTDRGRTWTKYAGNPVLDIGSAEFRDPKVIWHEPTKRWVMAVALAHERKIAFYASPDLKSWTHLSDFGPANATGGVWECPDLFEMAVDGDPNRKKWVLLVNLNPGSVAGGSGAQYFVGDFDGRAFTADGPGTYTPPSGHVLQDFEGLGHGAWTATGTAFGDAPAAGALPGQMPVTGFAGQRLANSFHGFDAGTGTLTSPPFTIDRPFVNFLVGGGRHPHDPAAVDGPAVDGTVFADFEGVDYGDGWTATGRFAGTTPPAGTLPGQQTVSGYEGDQLVNTFFDHDAGTGRIASPAFTIERDHINFLVGGGFHPYPGEPGNPPTAVTLVVDGEVVRSTTGQDSEALNWAGWDVSALRGRQARIEIVDENTGGWGHILADHFVFADRPAALRSTETAVNLVVDGEVVRTATGQNSEALDWEGWNVKPFAGKEARIKLVDNNTGGWGHILADQFTLSDEQALSTVRRSDWMDWGKDHYAANTFADAPGGRRISIAWMNNWEYAGGIPTSPWRSAMTVPRELALKTVDGRPRLIQTPVRELLALRQGLVMNQRTGASRLRRAARLRTDTAGKALDIELVLRPGTADRTGIKVRTGSGEETIVGYDRMTEELYLDRTRSGASAFSRDFPGVHRAPLAQADGRIRLRILVDWSSIEVFANGGRVTITDQIFPSPDSEGVRLFAEGGHATVEKLNVWRMRSAWAPERRARR